MSLILNFRNSPNRTDTYVNTDLANSELRKLIDPISEIDLGTIDTPITLEGSEALVYSRGDNYIVHMLEMPSTKTILFRTSTKCEYCEDDEYDDGDCYCETSTVELNLPMPHLLYTIKISMIEDKRYGQLGFLESVHFAKDDKISKDMILYTTCIPNTYTSPESKVCVGDININHIVPITGNLSYINQICAISVQQFWGSVFNSDLYSFMEKDPMNLLGGTDLLDALTNWSKTSIEEFCSLPFNSVGTLSGTFPDMDSDGDGRIMSYMDSISESLLIDSIPQMIQIKNRPSRSSVRSVQRSRSIRMDKFSSLLAENDETI